MWYTIKLNGDEYFKGFSPDQKAYDKRIRIDWVHVIGTWLIHVTLFKHREDVERLVSQLINEFDYSEDELEIVEM